ncbi:hypothetical protein GQ54DRAFT_263498 [Martensiomyces pterosporus]|nr:hypothetical protein GQ54DRAFT_263498 [Martensiomyces pterosporus]
MLRSKNLKKILEQALTKDICVCAVFNEDGVVLAHAATTRDFNISSLRTAAQHASQPANLFGGEPDTHHHHHHHHHNLAGPGQNGEPHYYEHEYGSQASSNLQYFPHSGGRGAGGVGPSAHGNGSDAGTSPPLQSIPPQLATATATAIGAARGSSRKRDSSQSRDSDSFASSFSDDLIDCSPNMSAREKLEDDLAIAASLWQSYENMSSLIERKDRDADEDLGDGASDMQDGLLGNDLHMAIVECEYGKVAVTRLGVYRLFLLSSTATPLGLLKLKSDNLCRFLEECLQCGSP